MTLWWKLAAVAGVVWLSSTALLGMAFRTDTLFGVAGPLVIAAATWVMVERTHRRNPTQLTPVFIKAFVAKLAFFGAYVVVMIGGLSLQPRPFAVSFTACFVALHLLEALRLRQLLAPDAHEG